MEYSKEKYIPPLNLQYIGNYSVDIDVDGNTMIAGDLPQGHPGYRYLSQAQLDLIYKNM